MQEEWVLESPVEDDRHANDDLPYEERMRRLRKSQAEYFGSKPDQSVEDILRDLGALD